MITQTKMEMRRKSPTRRTLNGKGEEKEVGTTICLSVQEFTCEIFHFPFSYKGATGGRLSVFNYNPANYLQETDGQSQADDHYNNDNDSRSSAGRDKRQAQNQMKMAFVRPQDLNPDATATEVIRAWAAQLKGRFLLKLDYIKR